MFPTQDPRNRTRCNRRYENEKHTPMATFHSPIADIEQPHVYSGSWAAGAPRSG